MNTNALHNTKDLINTFKVVKAKDHYIETRLLGSEKGIVSGYFDDADQFTSEILLWNGQVKGVYVTLNPIKDLPEGYVVNKLKPYAKQTTKDSDIAFRRWLLVDIDPKRASNCSSTESELDAAYAVAEKVKAFTAEQGFSQPIEAMSGNGVHLLYRISLKNTSENTKLVKDVLNVLHQKFSTEEADVDITTYNAARISKVYGTLSCKGEDTEERPHRLARIEKLSKLKEKTSEESLKKVAEMLEVSKVPNNVMNGKDTTPMNAENAKKFDVEAFIKRHNIEVNHQKNEHDGVIYVLKVCPWNSEHTDKAAYIKQFTNGAIAAGCHHASCEEHDWHSLRTMLEPRQNFNGQDKKEEKSPGDTLKDIIDALPLYVDEASVTYTIITKNNRTKTVELKSKDFKNYLIYQYTNVTKKGYPVELLQQIIQTIQAKAQFEAIKRPRHLRAAFENNALFYNLGNAQGDVVEITKDAVSILETSPICFIESSNHAPQVTPDFQNADITKLFKHIPLNATTKLLYTVYICTAFLPHISHAILVLQGEKGAAKSTTMQMTRQLIDPAIQPRLQLVKNDRDFTTTLFNNYAASFDNVSELSKEKSDTLCMTSTGGAISLRKLYTNSEEILLDIRRIIMLNGINFEMTESDLVDRSLLIRLNRISSEQRKTELQIWADFEKDKPAILGGIFTTLQKAMKLYPNIQLDEAPRLADFATWGYAIAEAINEGDGSKFLSAYEQNRHAFNAEIVEGHPLLAAVKIFMSEQSEWKGQTADLLGNLDKVAKENRIDMNDSKYPKSASYLSRRLKEVQSNLNDIGIDFSIKNVGKYKEITLTNDN